jgi:hypothetical protein
MSEHAKFLARYRHLRQVGLELNNRLVETLPKRTLDEGGKKLGILKNNVLVLDTEDEIAVLMDYCLHDVRRQGLTAVQRFLAKTPPPPDSDEMVLLQALSQARFSLFTVEAAEPGIGVHVRDVLRNEALFLMDVGFSQTASRGMTLAARVMAPEGMNMTTGAALPVGVLSPKQQAAVRRRARALFPDGDLRKLTPEQSSALAAQFIRDCLKRGAAEHIEYTEPGATGGGRSWGPAAAPPARRVGRNDPCPCGSGKKFKQCCGARR